MQKIGFYSKIFFEKKFIFFIINIFYFIFSMVVGQWTTRFWKFMEFDQMGKKCSLGCCGVFSAFFGGALPPPPFLQKLDKSQGRARWRYITGKTSNHSDFSLFFSFWYVGQLSPTARHKSNQHSHSNIFLSLLGNTKCYATTPKNIESIFFSLFTYYLLFYY